MYISDMIEELENILETQGDLIVMHDNDMEITSIRVRVAKKDEFPAEYLMPEGHISVLME